MKMTAIQKPSAEGAIVDMDRALPGATQQTLGNLPWTSSPDEPVHAAKRNYGFFAGSVQNFTAHNHDKSYLLVRGQYSGWFTALK